MKRVRNFIDKQRLEITDGGYLKALSDIEEIMDCDSSFKRDDECIIIDVDECYNSLQYVANDMNLSKYRINEFNVYNGMECVVRAIRYLNNEMIIGAYVYALDEDIIIGVDGLELV